MYHTKYMVLSFAFVLKFCGLQAKQRDYGATRRSHLGTHSDFKDTSSGPPSSGSQVRVAFRRNGAPNSSNMLSDDPPYEGEESDEEKL
jgi:hypothetical protein